MTAQRPARPARREQDGYCRPCAWALAPLAAAAAVGWILAYTIRTHDTATAQAPIPAPGRHLRRPPHRSLPRPSRALKPVSAMSFDPYGDGRAENNQLAPLAIDASPATAWHTDWYTTARFGNLKPGTGLLLDMGREVTIKDAVTRHSAALPAPTSSCVSAMRRHSLQDLRPVAHAANAGGAMRLQLTKPAHARYVLIWFTNCRRTDRHLPGERLQGRAGQGGPVVELREPVPGGRIGG